MSRPPFNIQDLANPATFQQDPRNSSSNNGSGVLPDGVCDALDVLLGGEGALARATFSRQGDVGVLRCDGNVVLIHTPRDRPVNGDGVPGAPGPDTDDPAPSPPIAHIGRVEDLLRIGDLPVMTLNWIEPDVLPMNMVTGLIGDSGVGKTSFALSLAVKHHATGGAVLVLDRENPQVTLSQYFDRLHVPVNSTRFNVWGEFSPEPAPLPDDPRVLDWVRRMSADAPPLVIIDPLIAFLSADESDSIVMRTFARRCSAISGAGGTVLLLHHLGKAGDPRGSSDFRPAIDHAFIVTGGGDRLHLKCYKGSRVGLPLGTEISYRYEDGRYIRRSVRQAGPIPIDQRVAEIMTGLLQAEPGITGGKLDEQALAAGVPRQQARRWIQEGIDSGRIVAKKGGYNAMLYSFSSPS